MLDDESWTVTPTVPLNSSGLACTPVAAPVTMTPSERKNSAARAVSSMLTSDVRAWELRKDTHTNNACRKQQQQQQIVLCSGFEEHILGEISWCDIMCELHNENRVILWRSSWCSGWFCPSCWCCSYLCFFLISVKIIRRPAPMFFRYLSKSPAQAFRRPSSATWEKTKPSALIKSRPVTRLTCNTGWMGHR